MKLARRLSLCVVAALVVSAALLGKSMPSLAQALDEGVIASCHMWESQIGPPIGLYVVYDHGAAGCQLTGKAGTPSEGGTLTIYPNMSTSMVCVEGHGFNGGFTQYANGVHCSVPAGPAVTPTPQGPSPTASGAPSASATASAGATDAGLPPFNFGLLGGGQKDVYLEANGTARIDGVFHVFKPGDTISTNAFTGGVIHIPGVAAFNLAPNARFTIGGKCGDRPALGTLRTGSLHMLETTPVEGATEFRLPSAGHTDCISVKGTEFVLESNGAHAAVVVLSGRVTVSDPDNGKSVDVGPGQELAVVNGNLNAGGVRAISSSLDQWWKHEVSPVEFFAAAGAGLLVVNLVLATFFWRRGRQRLAARLTSRIQ